MPRESLTEYRMEDVGPETQLELKSLLKSIKNHVKAGKENDGEFVVKDKHISFGLFANCLKEQGFKSVITSRNSGDRPTENDTIVLLPYTIGKDDYPQDVPDTDGLRIKEIHPLLSWSPKPPKNSGAFLIKVGFFDKS